MSFLVGSISLASNHSRLTNPSHLRQSRTFTPPLCSSPPPGYDPETLDMPCQASLLHPLTQAGHHQSDLSITAGQVPLSSLHCCRLPTIIFHQPVTVLSHPPSSLLVLARCRPLLDFGPSSASFKVWLINSPNLLSAPFEVWFIINLGNYRPLLEFGPLLTILNLHLTTTYHSRLPPTNLYCLQQSPPSTTRSRPLPPPSSLFQISNIYYLSLRECIRIYEKYIIYSIIILISNTLYS
jgi:hypothetical protein